MSKFQEDEMFFIYSELAKNPKLNKIFQKKLTKISNKDKYKHRPFFEQYTLSFKKAKEKYEKKFVTA